MSINDWDIRREGRRWSREELERRLYQAPEKIEFVGGIFASEGERLTVLGMLLEILGIDKVLTLGNIADWKGAIADLEKRRADPSTARSWKREDLYERGAKPKPSAGSTEANHEND